MTPATIMLVEHNAFTRRTVRSALEERGHAVLEAPNGSSALTFLSGQPVDLILQDLVLPDIDGFDLIARMRALPHGEKTSILAFSGLLSKLEEARVAALGFDDLVVKPMEASRLIPLIEAHLLGPTSRDRIGEGRRLVLADDDPLQLKLTRFRLEKLGFAVEATSDGKAALEALRRSRADGVVSDVLMPRLDGFGLALAVRADPRLSGIPVLLVTSSYVDESDRALARSVGANDLVVRTPDQRELTDALRIMLRERPPTAAPALAPPVLEQERSVRVVHQLERQVTLNSGLAQRCSALAAELAVLSGISEAVVRHQDLERALDEALGACLDLGGITAGALYLLQPDARMRVRSLHGNGDTSGLASFFDNEVMLRDVIASRRPTTVPSEVFPSDWSQGVLERCAATFAFVVPLLQRDRPAGAFFVAVKAQPAELDDWRVFVQGLGSQITQAMSLARTFGEKEEAERIATEQAEFLQLILDSIGDGVIAVDPAGRVVRMNEVAAGLTGRSPREAMGQPTHELFELLDEFTREPIADVFGTSAKHALLTTRHGRECPVAVACATIHDQASRGHVLVLRDITDARRAERALLLSEERFRSTFEQAAVGMAHVAPDGRWLDVNQRLCDIVGYSRSELLTLTSNDITFRDDAAADLAAVSEALAGRVSTFSLEKRYIRKDGELAWVDATTSLVRDKEGVADYFITVIQDISLRKRTEEELERTSTQLRQSQKMEAIGQLAGGVAHDFNNLLSVIRGHSELLLEDLRPEDPLHADIAEIAYACERACSLTRQLLVLSRKQVVAPQVIDPNEVTAGLSKLLARMIGEDIELALRLNATGRVYMDRGQLEQVLINLVVNARDAMPQGGTLTIATNDAASTSPPAANGSVASSVELSVTDTGVGMPPDVRDRIFEPFFTTKEAGKGTGLGLSTVAGIVQQSEGDIRIDSQLGEGTTFTVRFPATREVAVVPTGAKSRVGARSTETILLVEDDDQVRSIAKTILERSGYLVLDASSAARAIEISEQFGQSIHLLLTDIVMPNMNGRRLAEHISRQRPQIKILFMSGYTDDAIVHREVLNAGMAFVQKPVAVDALLGKLREVLDGR